MSLHPAVLRRIPVVMAFAAAVCAAPTATPAQETAEGTLELVWGDPVSTADTLRTLFTLRIDDGRRIPLRFDPATLESPEGPFSLAGTRVSVRLAERVQAVTRPEGGAVRAVEIRGQEPGARWRGPPVLQSSAAAATRVLPYVTLMCRFPDWTEIEPATPAQLRSRLDVHPGPAHYWAEVSAGQMDVSGPVHGWYTLPRPREAYVGRSDADLHALTTDCAAAADADVFFPDFVGINFLFNTDLGCCAWGGQSVLALDGPTRLYGTTWLYGESVNHLGVIAHEMGHSFGLPHSSGSYGLTYDSYWDVMSAAVWHPVPGTSFRTSSHTNSYHKQKLGLVPADRIFEATPGEHSILMAPTSRPTVAGYLAVRLPTPAFDPWEYYTLEVRGGTGYDAPLPGQGVVIHRIGGGGATPSNVLDLDGNGEPGDRGAVLEPGEWFVDRANGIRVNVVGREGASFRVRVAQDDYPRLVVDTAARSYGAVLGDPRRLIDSARVTLLGVEDGTRWRADVTHGAIELLADRGANGDWVRWAYDSRALGAGAHSAGLRVRLGEIQEHLSLTLRVEGVDGLAAHLGRPIVADSALEGSTVAAIGLVGITGPGADTAAWVATASSPRIALQAAAGRGPTYLRWTRPAGLPPGLYEDTIRVVVPGAAGSPLDLVLRHRVIERPVVTVTRLRGSATAPQGGLPVLDSIRVDLSGRMGTGGAWYPTGTGPSHVSFESFPPPGSGWLQFRRVPGDLPPGMHVSAIQILLLMDVTDTVTVMDTLVVLPATPAIRVAPDHRTASLMGATEMSRDSVFIQPEGPGSARAAWSVEFPYRRLSPHTYYQVSSPAEGTGPGWLYYIRILEDRAPGLYVDTAWVRLRDGSGATAFFVDSLTILGPPTLTLGTGTGGARAVRGSDAAIADSAVVSLTGVDAGALGWTATASVPWITLETASGIGSGVVRWRRSAVGLDVGTHTATIRVTAPAAGSPGVIEDSITVVGPLVVRAPARRPPGLVGAAYADTLAADGGLAPPLWTVLAGSLPPGLALDSASGRIQGIPETAGAFAFTVQARADAEAVTADLVLDVGRPALAVDAVMDALLAGPPLPEDHRRFLDLLGNRNGRLDIGDVLAWITDPATDLTAADRETALRRLQTTRTDIPR